MKIGEKAAQNSQQVWLAGELKERSPSTILAEELVPADEISDDGEFPKFGEYLEVEKDGEEEFWECPQGLAAAIVGVVPEELETVVGCEVVIDLAAQEGPQDNWVFSVQVNAPDAD